MSKKTIKLEILMGLPGSGKSTFAKEQKQHGVCILPLDTVRDRLYYVKSLTLDRCVREAVQLFCNANCTHIIVDGLILTCEEVKIVIDAIACYYNLSSVTIHRWNEDRETCLKNDGGRRDRSSSVTILNAPYEEVDIERLRETSGCSCNIHLVRHQVQLKEDWLRYFKGVMEFPDDGKLRSDKWCTGGSYGSCWHDGLTHISGDEPLDFQEFDDLLLEICPQVTYLQYKKLRSSCVKTESSSEHDYYGGGTSYLNWVCDLRHLYEMLHELKLVS